MLVLSRKSGESLCIGDHVTVTVVRIAPGVVRIGIDAPANAVIARGELLAEDPGQDGVAKPGGAGANRSPPR